MYEKKVWGKIRHVKFRSFYPLCILYVASRLVKFSINCTIRQSLSWMSLILRCKVEKWFFKKKLIIWMLKLKILIEFPFYTIVCVNLQILRKLFVFCTEKRFDVVYTSYSCDTHLLLWRHKCHGVILKTCYMYL